MRERVLPHYLKDLSRLERVLSLAIREGILHTPLRLGSRELALMVQQEVPFITPLFWRLNFLNRRGSLDITADILRRALNGALKTRIVYGANLNFRMLNRYLERLEKSGASSDRREPKRSRIHL